jgi:hypothetical protein
MPTEEMVLINKLKYEKMMKKIEDQTSAIQPFMGDIPDTSVKNVEQAETGDKDRDGVSALKSEPLPQLTADPESSGEEKKKTIKHTDLLLMKAAKYRDPSKIARILAFINKNGNGRLTWDQHGVISYKGKIIPKSNIIDIIVGILTKKKTVGTDVFLKAMMKIKMPEALLKTDSMPSKKPMKWVKF